MQFTSLTFLLVFLPVLVAAYYLAPMKFKNAVLLIFSLIFYSCGSSSFLLIMCILTVANIVLAFLIRKSLDVNSILPKLLLVVGILLNVCTLGYHKYWGFFVNASNSILHTNVEAKSILLPLGISFYTFKALSYLIDVYCGKIDEVSPLGAAVYLTFFAQIQSGPIDRYNSFAGSRNYSLNFISDGVVKFMRGFAKKVIVADVLSQVVSETFDSTAVLSTPLAWLGSICFSLQLYYDFSGYSDMAIGIGQLLGIDCKLNFDFPYISKSISEFWRRWHISLGAWFRDYIYIPLGGSRVSRGRNYFNLFCVWFLTGLWHGAGLKFIVWGLGYFVLIAFEKTFDLPNRFKSAATKIVYRIFTLLFVNFQWVLFRASKLSEGLRYLKSMVVYSNAEVPTMRAEFLFKDYFWIILAAVIFSMPICNVIKEKIESTKLKMIYEIVDGIVLVALFVVAVSFVVSEQNNPFLYGNF